MKSIFLFLALLTGVYTSHANILIKSFEGSTDGKITIINWDLEAPSYTATATLERSSDGILFTSVKIFEVQTDFKNNGTFSENLASGAYYYRLKITKPGFIPLTSNIVTVKVSGTTTQEYKVMNPIAAEISVRGIFPAGRVMIVELTDMNGRRVMVKELAPAAHQSITISAASIYKGSYILTIRDKNSKLPIITRTVYKQ